MTDPIALVNEQAEDEGLWFIDATCSEAYLQAALRKLHAAVEARAPAATPPTAWAIMHVNCAGVWKLTEDKNSADYWERSGFPVQPLYAAPSSPCFDRCAVIEECAKIADECVTLANINYGVAESVGAHMAARRIRDLATVSRPHGKSTQ